MFERNFAELKRYFEKHKKQLYLTIATTLVALGVVMASSAEAKNPNAHLTQASTSADGYIVRPDDGVDLESIGLEAVGEVSYPDDGNGNLLPESVRFAVVRPREGTNASMLVATDLEAMSGVESIEKNGYLWVDGRYPNDPLFGGVNNPGEMWGWAALGWKNAYSLWTVTNIPMATIDTGCPDNYVQQTDWPFIPWQDRFLIHNGKIEEGRAIDLNNEGHGTHVGGIMWAVPDNGLGMAGLLSGSGRKVCIKAFHGNSATYEDVTLALVKARMEGVRLVNGSFGGGNSDLVQDALDFYLAADNSWAVFACGNNGYWNETCTFPGSLAGLPGYERVFSVMALGKGLVPATYSNRGGSYWMPGSEIWSTTPLGHRNWSGTSMAAPHLTGLLAAVLEQHPDFDGYQMRQMLNACAQTLANGGLMPNWQCVGEDPSVWTSVYLPILYAGERTPVPTPWATPTIMPVETSTPGSPPSLTPTNTLVSP